MTDDPKTLVSSDWLAAHLDDPNLIILDGSYHMPATGRSGHDEYLAAHLPRAQFFDIDEISENTSKLPHMAPSPDDFAARVGALGVGDDTQVVVYDDSDVRSAARVWWTFRLMGLDRVAVLDGGLAKWRAEGRPLQAGPVPAVRRSLTVNPQPQRVRSSAEVAAASHDDACQIIDARSAERFRGDVPEPRPGLRAGHIPNARNVPFSRLFGPDGTMKPVSDLQAAFDAAGVDPARHAITSCGSGITASVLALALARMGRDDWSLYDGSWTEWGSLPELPIATGDED